MSSRTSGESRVSWMPKVHWCERGVKTSPSGSILQNTYCRAVRTHTVHHRLLHMLLQASQSAHANSCPLLKAPTMGMWTGPWSSRRPGGLVWSIMFSFISHGWYGVCASDFWHEMVLGCPSGRRQDFGQWRQCDALGSTLLGNFGSWPSCGCPFDT